MDVWGKKQPSSELIELKWNRNPIKIKKKEGNVGGMMKERWKDLTYTQNFDIYEYLTEEENSRKF